MTAFHSEVGDATLHAKYIWFSTGLSGVNFD